MTACMGGWCKQRDTCPNYLHGQGAPAERLCVAGVDGLKRGAGVDRPNRRHLNPNGSSKVVELARWMRNTGEHLNTSDAAIKLGVNPNTARALLSAGCRMNLVRRLIPGGGGGHQSLYGAPTGAA